MSVVAGNLFDRLANLAATTTAAADPFTEGIYEVLGEGTLYEAAFKVVYDEHDGDWGGFLVFKDDRFSPLEAGILQLKYPTPGAASGTLARARAVTLWETLCGVFLGLLTESAILRSKLKDLGVDVPAEPEGNR